MSDELKSWDEERMIAECEALAAHFKRHDLDHYEMSRMILRDMRSLRDAESQRIAELEDALDTKRAAGRVPCGVSMNREDAAALHVLLANCDKHTACRAIVELWLERAERQMEEQGE